jgi:chorismate synthase
MCRGFHAHWQVVSDTGVGCIVDGVPPRMQLTEEEIQVQLDRRRPGQAGAGAISTGRNEADAVQILSGRDWCGRLPR